MSPRDLRAYDIYEGEKISFEFEGGIVVKGEIITGTRNLHGRVILISLDKCTVTYKDEVLFKPEWGKFDMAVGKEVISAFAGPADWHFFDMITHKPGSTTIKSKKTPEKEEWNLFMKLCVTSGRENTKFSLQAAFDILKKHHPKDWLLSVEIYELAYGKDEKLAAEVLEHLEKVKQQRPKVAHLVDNGLGLIKSDFELSRDLQF